MLRAEREGMPVNENQRSTAENALATRDRASAVRGARRSLMSKPQPLGILPSFGFWQELWRTDPQLHLFFTLMWATLNAPFVYLTLRYLSPSWLSLILVLSLPVLSMGVAERWLRFLVVRRRRSIAARQPGPREELSAELDDRSSPKPR